MVLDGFCLPSQDVRAGLIRLVLCCPPWAGLCLAPAGFLGPLWLAGAHPPVILPRARLSVHFTPRVQLACWDSPSWGSSTQWALEDWIPRGPVCLIWVGPWS